MAIASEEEWAERAAAFLKHKLRECEVTYPNWQNGSKSTV